jgi:outer membrane protein assembly factor BamB
LVLSTESLYAGTAGKRIYHLNSKTGEVMREFVASAELYWQFVLSRDSLITHIGEKTLICLPKSLDKPQWTQDSTTPWSSSRPYVWQGLAIVGTEDGRVDALQLTDGKRQWTYKFTGPLVVSAGMKVFCTSGRAGVGSTRSSRNKDLKFQPDLTQPKEKGI